MINEGRIRRVFEAARAAESGSADQTSNHLRVPDIVEFVRSPEFVGPLALHPRQLTLLKVIFLDLDRLTDLDYRVLGTWAAGLERVDDQGRGSRFEGSYGIQPDVLDRMRWCREHGRPWFRDVVAVIGRRGSKNYIGAICAAYILWWHLALGDPQRHFNIALGKRLTVDIFAGRHDQAIANQFKDIVALITNCRCFKPFLATEPVKDRMLFFSPAQLADGRRPRPEQAAFEIVARQSTPLAGRGQASIALFMDEMAHVDPATASHSAEEIFTAARPAQAQFPLTAFCYQPSSPRSKVGQFYVNYRQSLELDPRTGHALYPDQLMVQLPTWDLFEDYELTQGGDLEMAPGGPTFIPIESPTISVDDDWLRRERETDPHGFNTEHGAQWATTVDAYLDPDTVKAIFGPWPGDTVLPQRAGGPLSIRYHGHADPSVTNDNFGLAIGHLEEHDGVPHVVFDLIKHWSPGDFPDHRIDYDTVERELEAVLAAFALRELTFDQHNSAFLINRLNRYVREHRLPTDTAIYEIPATRAMNFEKYELLKRAALARWIHAPPYELAEQELAYLRRDGARVDHQRSGPIKSKDIADCMVEVVWRLLSPYGDVHAQLSALPLHASQPGGLPLAGPPPISYDESIFRQLSRGRSLARRSRGHNPARGRLHWR